MPLKKEKITQDDDSDVRAEQNGPKDDSVVKTIRLLGQRCHQKKRSMLSLATPEKFSVGENSAGREDRMPWHIEWLRAEKQTDIIMSLLSGEVHDEVSEEDTLSYGDTDKAQKAIRSFMGDT